MIKGIKNIFRIIKRRSQLFFKVNWIKTLYFNYKKFPFSTARKLPIFFFGNVRFSDISGEVEINGPIKRAMIGFGQSFEFPTTYRGIAEISLRGKLVFNGYAQIGKDCVMLISENARCEFGYMAALGSSVKLICSKEIILGDWTGVGYESQIIDTNSHPMMNTETGEHYPITGTIKLGDYNSVSNRVSIMQNTVTPDYCVVASNSLCNSNYTNLGTHILLGGIPSKLIKNNFTRDWESEKERLKRNKLIHW